MTFRSPVWIGRLDPSSAHAAPGHVSGTPLVLRLAAAPAPVGSQLYDLPVTRVPAQLADWQYGAFALRNLGPAPQNRQADWPVPTPQRPATLDHVQGRFPGLPSTNVQPFSQPDWPVPAPPRPATLDWTPPSQAAIRTARPYFANHDWPVVRPLPMRVLDDVWQRSLALPTANVKPFAQTDWPVTRATPTWPQDWQALAYAPFRTFVAPFAQSDWPVPQPQRPFTQDHALQRPPGLPAANVKPFHQDDWPLHMPPRGILQTWTASRFPALAVLAPFAQLDWPVPVRARPSHPDWALQRFLDAAVATTFSPGSGQIVFTGGAPTLVIATTLAPLAGQIVFSGASPLLDAWLGQAPTSASWGGLAPTAAAWTPLNPATAPWSVIPDPADPGD